MLNDQSQTGHSPLTRRAMLGGAAVGGMAALLPSAAQAASSKPAPAPAPTQPSAIQIFEDPTINLQVLFALGASAYGASELGEMLTIIDQIRARGSSDRAVFEIFQKWGRDLRDRAETAARLGRTITARDCYLRATAYLNQALFFVLASAQPTRKHEGEVYKEMDYCWTQAALLMSPQFIRVSIPYKGRPMPGWLLVPPGPTMRRPTVILNNGSDGQNIDSYVYGGSAALERGWNALMFEGPGQGSNLFLHDIIFPPAWEQVVTPVVDFLRECPEVDPQRIVLLSQSFGGYLVTRAAAFEHRLAAVVADPGVYDVFAGWTTGKGALPKSIVSLIRAGKQAEFDHIWRHDVVPTLTASERFVIAKRSEIYGNHSFYARMRQAMKFRLDRSVAQQITAPIALTQAAQEAYTPGQAKTLYEWVKAQPKAFIPFTTAEGAQLHCEPMAATVRNDAVFDWVEANLRPTA